MCKLPHCISVICQSRQTTACHIIKCVCIIHATGWRLGTSCSRLPLVPTRCWLPGRGRRGPFQRLPLGRRGRRLFLRARCSSTGLFVYLVSDSLERPGKVESSALSRSNTISQHMHQLPDSNFGSRHKHNDAYRRRVVTPDHIMSH